MREIFIRLNIQNTMKNCQRICGDYIFTAVCRDSCGTQNHLPYCIRKMWWKSLQTSSQGLKKIPGILPEVPVVS